MWLIGRRCKCGNVLSWPILIGRGLDLNNYGVSKNRLILLRSVFDTQKRVKTPQGVWHIFGGNSKEVTPVPIPNTVVKLFSADDTWWATARESKTLPEFAKGYPLDILFCFANSYSVFWLKSLWISACLQKTLVFCNPPLRHSALFNSVCFASNRFCQRLLLFPKKFGSASFFGSPKCHRHLFNAPALPEL